MLRGSTRLSFKVWIELERPECIKELRPIGTPKARARIPARTRAVRAVTPILYVPQRARCFSLNFLIENRVHEPKLSVERLVDQSYERRPERCYCARSTDHRRSTVDLNDVSGLGVGVAAHVRHSASLVPAWVCR